MLLLNRGSDMSAHVLLNLLNELGKRDKMRGLTSILSLFRNEFDKFNNTRARILDSILLHGVISLPDATSYDNSTYHMCHFQREHIVIFSKKI